jgi:hypothetical protein
MPTSIRTLGFGGFGELLGVGVSMTQDNAAAVPTTKTGAFAGSYRLCERQDTKGL